MSAKDDIVRRIGKLIRQRKAENEAFLKLLNAMDANSPGSKKQTQSNKSGRASGALQIQAEPVNDQVRPTHHQDI